jgi:hypothetical protein
MRRMGQWGILARAVGLLVLFTAFWLLAAPLAGWLSGRQGLLAAGLAALVCLVSGWVAMGATALLAPPTQPAAHVLLGMMVRMSLPLLVCLVTIQRYPWLIDAGFAWFLIAAFCLALGFETLISIGQLETFTG